MPVAIETFLSQLSESGILSDQKYRAAERKKSEHQDGEALAREMIKSGHLTKYQAEQILSGKGKNLCMGQYVLLEKLGAGGMGQVYKAYHPGMERMVAIKVILAKGSTDAETVKRFEREIKAAAKLAHPNIITVYDAGNAKGRHFMVMELVKGEDLSELISQKGRFSVRDTVDYITQAAKGLKFAHANGVIHRDIKPGNLILDSDGVLKIVDMGLAKIHSKENDETVSMLTGNAAIMGTVDFMSPEQSLSTKNVDGRADIYSLGATLYYMLTGDVMYPGKTAMVKLMAHRKSLIPSLRISRPDVTENLDAIYTKMVAKDLDDRYQNMSELISDLELAANGFAPVIKSKEMMTLNSLQNDFGGLHLKAKGTNLKLGKSTINFKGILANKKLLIIICGTLIGFLLLIFILFFFISIFGEVLKSNQVIPKEKNQNIKSEFINSPNKNIANPIIAEKKSDQNDYQKLPSNETNAKEIQLALAKSLNRPVEEKEDIGKGIKLEMVLIPAGKFMMGSPTTEVGRNNNETQHEVKITQSYYLGKYEVTQEQWEEVMGGNPSFTKGAKLPVTMVSWEDCQEFIKKLNAKTNRSYRLPTEAEWEYACRAGTITAYSFGARITKSNSNSKFGTSRGKAVIVGSFKANGFGLFDMHGNVWEWCEDWFGAYDSGPVTDPMGPAMGEFRVLRGGSFLGIEWRARSSSRGNFGKPTYKLNGDVGFRLAITADIKNVAEPTLPKSDPVVVMPATRDLLIVPFNEAKAKEVQKEVVKSLKKEVEEKADLGNGVSLDLIHIPSGKFTMGSPTTEVGRKNDETQHEVTLTKPFYIGKYEVT